MDEEDEEVDDLVKLLTEKVIQVCYFEARLTKTTAGTPSHNVEWKLLKISPQSGNLLKIMWRMQENWEMLNLTQISS
jgi:hypothetical protein